MTVKFEFARRLAAACLLLALAACSTTTVAPSPEAEATPPPMSGETNDPAPGFQNVQPGSEEDFILNVGRRTYFTKDSATLDSVARTTLDAQAAWLVKYPRWKVKIQGFADDGGSDSQQVSLSQKRADAVQSHLAGAGVDRSRMLAKGYGKERAVRDCPDTACKVQNRRVVSNLRDQNEEL